MSETKPMNMVRHIQIREVNDGFIVEICNSMDENITYVASSCQDVAGILNQHSDVKLK